MKKIILSLIALSSPSWGVIGSGVQPIVPAAQVVFGSPQQTLTSTPTVTISTITGTLAVQDITISGTCSGPGCTSGTGGVPSVNLSGNPAILTAVTIAAGSNITASQSGSTITINSSASGGGGGILLSSFTATQPILYNNTTGAFSSTLISLSTGVTGILPSTSVGGLVSLSSFSAVQPVLYNNATGVFSSTLISATTGMMGTLQAAQEPAHTGDVTNNAGSLAMTAASVQANIREFTAPITAASSATFQNTVLVSSTIALGTAGTTGTAGQALESGGPNSVPTWATVTAGASGANGAVQIAQSGSLGNDATMTFSTTTKALSVAALNVVNVSTPGAALLYELQTNGVNYAGIVANSSFSVSYVVQLPTTTPPAGDGMVFTVPAVNSFNINAATGTWAAFSGIGACPAGQYETGSNQNGAPTCSAPVTQANVSGNAAITGPVTFAQGTNITLSQAGSTITVTSASGSGVPSVNLSANAGITTAVTVACGGNMTCSQSGSTITVNSNSAGGGSPNGQVNNGNTYQVGYYSVTGSSNVINGSSNLQVNPSSVTTTVQTFHKNGTAYGITAVSGNYTAVSTDTVIAVTASTTTNTNPIITLPSATGSGQILTITKVDISTASVTIKGVGSDVVAGTGTLTLNAFTQTDSIVDSASGIWSPWGSGIQVTPAQMLSLGIGTTATIVQASNNDINVFSVCNSVPASVTAFTFEMGTTITGVVDFGIYDINKNLIAHTGGITNPTTAATTTHTITPVNLPAGCYYMAVAGSVNTLDFLGFSITGAYPSVGLVTGGASTGVLPATLGTITAPTATKGGIFFQARLSGGSQF